MQQKIALNLHLLLDGNLIFCVHCAEKKVKGQREFLSFANSFLIARLVLWCTRCWAVLTACPDCNIHVVVTDEKYLCCRGFVDFLPTPNKCQTPNTQNSVLNRLLLIEIVWQ